MTEEDCLPSEARREILRECGREFGLNVFIETGTNDGATPWFLKDDFKELHTIELDEGVAAGAAERFLEYRQVTCYQGDSVNVLTEVLEKINEPALVWLDGHFQGPGTASGEQNCPALTEIQILFDDNGSHVILVDDARCFLGGKHNPIDGTPVYDHFSTWPSLSEVQDLAEAEGYAFLVEDDIIRLTPNV